MKQDLNFFIHPKAIVETKNIGKKTTIWAFTHILPKAKIGKNVNIAEHCFIENEVIIGDNCTIKCGVSLWDGIILEDNVFIGPSATFTNDLYPRSKNKDFTKKTTLLKQGCSIGANTTILAGVTIGKYAMVGAGSVVTNDVYDFTLVYGHPAKIQGYVCQCGHTLKIKIDKAECTFCGNRYTIINKNKVKKV